MRNAWLLALLIILAACQPGIEHPAPVEPLPSPPQPTLVPGSGTPTLARQPSPPPTPSFNQLPLISPGNAPRLGQVARLGKGTIYDFAWLPDGKRLVAAGLEFTPDGRWLVASDQQGKIRGWDVASGRLLKTVEGRGDIALSPDGLLLAFKPTLDDIAVWDVTAGREIFRAGGERPLAFSPNGLWLAVGSQRGFVNLWGVR